MPEPVVVAAPPLLEVGFRHERSEEGESERPRVHSFTDTFGRDPAGNVPYNGFIDRDELTESTGLDVSRITYRINRDEVLIVGDIDNDVLPEFYNANQQVDKSALEELLGVRLGQIRVTQLTDGRIRIAAEVQLVDGRPVPVGGDGSPGSGSQPPANPQSPPEHVLQVGFQLYDDFFAYSFGDIDDLIFALALVSAFQISRSINLQARDMEARQKISRGLNEVRGEVQGIDDKKNTNVFTKAEGDEIKNRLVNLRVFENASEMDKYFKVEGGHYKIKADGKLEEFVEKIKARLEIISTGEQLAFNQLNQYQSKYSNYITLVNRLIERNFTRTEGLVGSRAGG